MAPITFNIPPQYQKILGETLEMTPHRHAKIMVDEATIMLGGTAYYGIDEHHPINTPQDELDRNVYIRYTPSEIHLTMTYEPASYAQIVTLIILHAHMIQQKYISGSITIPEEDVFYRTFYDEAYMQPYFDLLKQIGNSN